MPADDDRARPRRSPEPTRPLIESGPKRDRCYDRRMHAAKKLATYEDLLTLPDGQRAEIHAGMIVSPPSPLPRHGRAQGVLGRVIGGPFDYDVGGGPGGWWILPEVDVRFTPNDVVRPDLAGWRRGRLPAPWDVRPIDVVPDWICEILSPSNAADDRVRKRRLYAAHGVAYYWLLDPGYETLEALCLDPTTKAWHEVGAYDANSIARIAPFDAVELIVSGLFPPR